MPEESQSDHPFPTSELALVMMLNKEKILPVEQVAIISNLIHKYLNIRSAYFYGDRD